MRRLGWWLWLAGGCANEASFVCTYDDTDLGDMYTERTLDCETYREIGEQQIEAYQAQCEEEVAAFTEPYDVDPATCTCRWRRRCRGAGND